MKLYARIIAVASAPLCAGFLLGTDESIVALGSTHVCALVADQFGGSGRGGSEVACWGGDGRRQVSSTPAGARFVALTAGGDGDWTCGLTVSGSTRCWGALPDELKRAAVSVHKDAGVRAVSRLGGHETISSRAMSTVNPLPGVRAAALSAGARHLCAVVAEGGKKLSCVGDDGGGVVSGAPAGGGWAAVSCAGGACCALPAASGSSATCWGTAAASLFATPTEPLAQLSVGVGGSACGVTQAGAALLCWGALAAPAAPRTVRAHSHIAAAAAATTAVSRSQAATNRLLEAAAAPGGPLWNATFELPGPFSQVSVGRDFACALTAAGTLDCFGGGAIPASASERFPGNALVLEVATAPDAACALYALPPPTGAIVDTDADPTPLLTCWTGGADIGPSHGLHGLTPPASLHPTLLL